MDLRAELVGRMGADGEAVAAFLASAEEYREVFTGSTSSIPWPYWLLEWEPEETAPAPVRRVLAVVRENTAWLRELITQYGEWPRRSLVGEDGADAAWLILQHCGSGVPTIGTPENLAFQRSCLPLLEQAVLAGEAHPRHLAHIADNLHERSGEPPEYAVLASAYSVVDGHPVFTRSADVPEIDRRRAAIGLAPLGEDVRRRMDGAELWPGGDERVEPWGRLLGE